MTQFTDVVGDDTFEWSPTYPAVYVAAIGSRRRDSDSDREQMLVKLAELIDEAESIGRRVVLVSGGASRGGDRHAELIARAADIDMVRFLPRRLARDAPYYEVVRALFDRNTRVVDLAEIVVAQVHQDRSGGTEDALKKAARLRRRVILLT